MLPFLTLAGLAGGGAWMRRQTQVRAVAAVEKGIKTAENIEPPITQSLQIDTLRLELGYGLLNLATGDSARLTEQIKVSAQDLRY